MTTPCHIDADVLRCGYAIGYFNEGDIVIWADHLILATSNPSAELLALSMIVLNKTCSIDVMNLRQSLSQIDSANSMQTQIGLLGGRLAKSSITFRGAFNALWALRDEEGITDEQRSQIYYLDDSYDHAIAGTWGVVKDVDRELEEFVTPYAERLAEQFPHLRSFCSVEYISIVLFQAIASVHRR